MLTKMLCSLYNHEEPWKVAATLYRGTIYLQEIETEEKRRQEATMQPQQRATCYWGLKFEDYVTSKGIHLMGSCIRILSWQSITFLDILKGILKLPRILKGVHCLLTCVALLVNLDPPPKAVPQSPTLPPAAPGTVNPHKAYSSVVRTRMNTHSIVMVGEVDCFDHVS